jgi:hypothetical protein
MSERVPVGTILTINNPAWPLTRQRVMVVGWVPLTGTGGALFLRLLADDDEKREQETPQAEAGTGPVDDGHFGE